MFEEERSEEYYLGVLDCALFIGDYVSSDGDIEALKIQLQRLFSQVLTIRSGEFREEFSLEIVREGEREEIRV